MELGVGVAYATALHHFALLNRELDCFNAVALTVMSRKDDAVRLGVILAPEYAVFHGFTLGMERLYGVKDGYFNVAVAYDYAEEARLFPIEVCLLSFPSAFPPCVWLLQAICHGQL